MESKHVAIIGAGLTGLSLAYFLSKHGIACTIFEKSNRCGGVIQTCTENNFTYECGPNTGVLGNIEIEKLLEELHPECLLETANETAKKRLIWKNNAWHALPSGLISAITTPLFSTFDKFRVLGEPFRKKGTNEDETIHEMVNRRLGKSFHDYAVAPFINGVYAGNTDELIYKYALAKLYALENNYGSFVGGMIQKQKLNKKLGIPSPSKKVFSTIGGLEQLIKALQNKVKDTIKLECSEIEIIPEKSNYSIKWIQNSIEQTTTYSHVITTCDAPQLTLVLPWLTENQKQIFSEIQYAPVIQASIGFNTWKGINIEAFGGLIPPKENRNLLGILFTSSMFTNRAPKNGAMLSVFMGGRLHMSIMQKTDDEIKEIIQKEVMELLKISDWNPDIFKIFRYERAITQYTAHIKQVLETINEIENNNKNLIIAGSLKNGIGMADRVKQAYDIAHQI